MVSDFSTSFLVEVLTVRCHLPQWYWCCVGLHGCPADATCDEYSSDTARLAINIWTRAGDMCCHGSGGGGNQPHHTANTRRSPNVDLMVARRRRRRRATIKSTLGQRLVFTGDSDHRSPQQRCNHMLTLWYYLSWDT